MFLQPRKCTPKGDFSMSQLLSRLLASSAQQELMLMIFASSLEDRSTVAEQESWVNSLWIHEDLRPLHDKFHSQPETERCRFLGGNHRRQSRRCQFASSPEATPPHESTSHSPGWPENGQRSTISTPALQSLLYWQSILACQASRTRWLCRHPPPPPESCWQPGAHSCFCLCHQHS